MGEQADYDIDQLENGSSYVKNKKTGEIILVDNIVLMYDDIYFDEDLYEIYDEIEALN